MTTKKTQKAGNNSNQTQVENLTIINGIDEQRARDIVEEKISSALANFTDEATNEAKNRSEKFNNKLIEKTVREQALSAFEDPSFQLLLVEAQKSAA